MNYGFKKIIAIFIASLLISSSTFSMQLIQKDEKLTKHFEDKFLEIRITELIAKLNEIYLFHEKSLQILGNQKSIIAAKDYPEEIIKELFDNNFYFDDFFNEDYIKNFPNNFEIFLLDKYDKQMLGSLSILFWSVSSLTFFVSILMSSITGKSLIQPDKVFLIVLYSVFGVAAICFSIVFAIKHYSDYKYKQSYRFLLEPDFENNNDIISKTEIQNYVNENLKIFIDLSKAIICDDNYECKVDNEILQKGLEKIKEYSLMFKELHEETLAL